MLNGPVNRDKISCLSVQSVLLSLHFNYILIIDRKLTSLQSDLKKTKKWRVFVI